MAEALGEGLQPDIFNGMSPSYATVIKQVLDIEQNTSSIMGLTVNFYQDGCLLYTTDFIRTLYIRQAFLEDYADNIDLELEVNPNTYMMLYEKQLNLTVSIVGTQMDSVTDSVSNKPIFYVKGKAIIRGKKNLMSEMNHKDIIKDDTDPTNVEKEQQHGVLLPMAFQIIDQTVYDLRHKKFNAIFMNSDVTAIAKYIADLYNVTLNMWPPDNVKSYTQLVIPPMKEVRDLFRYLQNRPGYGIYFNGVTHYITNDKLYVYPPLYFDTPMSEDHIIHFYKISKGRGITDTGLTRIDDQNNYHVIIDSEAKLTENADSGMENFGTGYLMLHSESLIDQLRIPLCNTPMKTNTMLNYRNTSSITFLNENGVVEKLNNQQYVETNGNSFQLFGQLHEALITTAAFSWKHAIPYSVYPNSRVYYYHETEANAMQRNGLCWGITYKIHRAGKLQKQLYACTADVLLALSGRNKN